MELSLRKWITTNLEMLKSTRTLDLFHSDLLEDFTKRTQELVALERGVMNPQFGR